MSDSSFSSRLLQFIADSLPSYESAVLLVFVSRQPDRSWSVEELAGEMGADALSRRELAQFLEHFERSALLQRMDDARFRFAPATPELGEVVAELRDAYDHRPVTLIRVVRDSANARLRSFSDSFRLKED